MRKSSVFFLLLSLAVTACASGGNSTKQAESEETGAFSRAMKSTRSGITDAALTPVEDLNLKREQIPDILKDIKDPYAVPTLLTCEEIAAQVTGLDEVLGRDWDAPKQKDERGLDDKAADGASNALLDTVASEAGGLIPFRGIVRTVSGANSWDKKVLRAYERGGHRRTFLKGLGFAQGCEAPAAPRPPSEEDSKIIFR